MSTPEIKAKYLDTADKSMNSAEALDSLYEQVYIAHTIGALTEDEAVEVSGKILDYMDSHEPRE